MLTDTALRALKPKEKGYKVADRDGMYVHVTTKGAMSFRMDYRLNGGRESLYLGKYAPDGLSLARAREKCIDARRAISEGVSPAIGKQHEKRRLKEAKSFGEFGEKWLQTDGPLLRQPISRTRTQAGNLPVRFRSPNRTLLIARSSVVVAASN